MTQAIQVAQAIGKPVKLTWPREEDMQNDQYRPMALTRLRVGWTLAATFSHGPTVSSPHPFSASAAGFRRGQ